MQDYLATLVFLAYTGGMETMSSAQQAARRAIQVMDGPANAARLLNVKGHRHQTVQSWLKNRVPAEHCPAIERVTRERGSVVTCEELRPDVDWAVLRSAVAAPAADREAA